MSWRINAKALAFPIECANGLSKRELLAAMAMQGFLANSEIRGKTREIAGWSLDAADALLEEMEANPL